MPNRIICVRTVITTRNIVQIRRISLFLATNASRHMKDIGVQTLDEQVNIKLERMIHEYMSCVKHLLFKTLNYKKILILNISNQEIMYHTFLELPLEHELCVFRNVEYRNMETKIKFQVNFINKPSKIKYYCCF